MNFFTRKPSQDEQIITIPRIQKADTPTLLAWFDNTIMGLGASFDRWRYHNDTVEEVEQHLDALNQMLIVLKSRKQ